MMTSAEPVGERSDEDLTGAVVVGLVAGQNPRVVREAARFAKLIDTSLVVVTVDMGRYLSFDDPTGMIPNSNLDLARSAADADNEAVELETAQALTGRGVAWTMRPLAGDPALAIAKLASSISASLIVVGTRKPGLGESLREFFNGSVAARLAHKQKCAVLIVPNGESDLPDALSDSAS